MVGPGFVLIGPQQLFGYLISNANDKQCDFSHRSREVSHRSWPDDSLVETVFGCIIIFFSHTPLLSYCLKRMIC